MAYGLLAVNVSLIIVIGWVVLRNVGAVLPTCQQGSVATSLLHTLPLSVLKKVFVFLSL